MDHLFEGKTDDAMMRNIMKKSLANHHVTLPTEKVSS